MVVRLRRPGPPQGVVPGARPVVSGKEGHDCIATISPENQKLVQEHGTSTTSQRLFSPLGQHDLQPGHTSSGEASSKRLLAGDLLSGLTRKYNPSTATDPSDSNSCNTMLNTSFPAFSTPGKGGGSFTRIQLLHPDQRVRKKGGEYSFRREASEMSIHLQESPIKHIASPALDHRRLLEVDARARNRRKPASAVAVKGGGSTSRSRIEAPTSTFCSREATTSNSNTMPGVAPAAMTRTSKASASSTSSSINYGGGGAGGDSSSRVDSKQEGKASSSPRSTGAARSAPLLEKQVETLLSNAEADFLQRSALEASVRELSSVVDRLRREKNVLGFKVQDLERSGAELARGKAVEALEKKEAVAREEAVRERLRAAEAEYRQLEKTHAELLERAENGGTEMAQKAERLAEKEKELERVKKEQEAALAEYESYSASVAEDARSAAERSALEKEKEIADLVREKTELEEEREKLQQEKKLLIQSFEAQLVRAVKSAESELEAAAALEREAAVQQAEHQRAYARGRDEVSETAEGQLGLLRRELEAARAELAEARRASSTSTAHAHSGSDMLDALKRGVLEIFLPAASSPAAAYQGGVLAEVGQEFSSAAARFRQQLDSAKDVSQVLDLLRLCKARHDDKLQKAVSGFRNFDSGNNYCTTKMRTSPLGAAVEIQLAVEKMYNGKIYEGKMLNGKVYDLTSIERKEAELFDRDALLRFLEERRLEQERGFAEKKQVLERVCGHVVCMKALVKRAHRAVRGGRASPPRARRAAAEQAPPPLPSPDHEDHGGRSCVSAHQRTDTEEDHDDNENEHDQEIWYSPLKSDRGGEGLISPEKVSSPHIVSEVDIRGIVSEIDMSIKTFQAEVEAALESGK